jgi:hypothetical protein
MQLHPTAFFFPRMRLAGVGMLIVLALSQGACQSFDDGAKTTFSKSFTCPAERIEARARPDLRPSEWLKGRKPSSEIASDPDRLGMWQKEQDQRLAYEDGHYWMYEARGCGHEVLYECYRPRKSVNTLVSQVSCSEREYLADMAKW